MGAVIFHAVSMTLIVFIAFPILLYQFTQKKDGNDSLFKVCQLIVAVATITVGCFASYSFSSHTTVHAICGLVIMCFAIPIWIWMLDLIPSLSMCSLSANRLQSVRTRLGLMMLLFVFPTQWMLGIEHVTYEAGTYTEGVAFEKFLGHYFPGYCFMTSGMGIIWLSADMEGVMKGEMNVLAPTAMIAMIGELAFSKGINTHFWHHTILESSAIALGVLMNIIYRIKVPEREKLHGLCMVMFWWLYGYMMIQHQTSGDLNETMHKVVGAANIGVAFVRMGCIYWNTSLLMVYGYLLFMAGFIFNFSDVLITNWWQKYLGYPGMAYISIVIFAGFYVATVIGIFSQLLNGKEVEMEVKMEEKADWRMDGDESTPLVVVKSTAGSEEKAIWEDESTSLPKGA